VREKIHNHLLYWILALKLDPIVEGRYNCNIIIIIISIFTILLRVKLIISYHVQHQIIYPESQHSMIDSTTDILEEGSPINYF